MSASKGFSQGLGIGCGLVAAIVVILLLFVVGTALLFRLGTEPNPAFNNSAFGTVRDQIGMGTVDPPKVGFSPVNPPSKRTERTVEQKKAYEQQRLADEAARKEREAAKKKAEEEAIAAKKKADDETAARLAAEEAKKREATAEAKLKIAKQLSNPVAKITKYQEVIDMYPETTAADEARELLKKLKP